MRETPDVEVAVLSSRSDLDLLISKHLHGYLARRVDDVGDVMEIMQRGGLVLVDLAMRDHHRWLTALQERGCDGPTVFLDARGDVTIDVRDHVVVSSPPTLSGLLAGFEEARAAGRGHRRRARAESDPRESSRSARRPPAAPKPVSVAERPNSVRVDPDSPQGQRDNGPLAVGSAHSRARRMDRRQATEATSLWGSLRRRSSVAAPSAAGEVGTRGPGEPARVHAAVEERRSGAPARVQAQAEQAFQAAFREAEAQPGSQRRIATSEGRVRVLTDEELFAGQSTSRRVAVELGTVLTPVPSPERRARTDA
jgi:hypothetical protein